MKQISQASKIIFIFLWLIFLLPLLTYPISLDLAVFARGGEVLLKGGKLYTDYIDLKPPLIHYILAFVQIITPAGETGLRTFDLVWQMIIAFVFAKVVSRLTGDERTGYTAAVLYALIYTAGFYEATFQCESFLALPLVLFFYIQVFKSNIPRFQFMLGALVGLCIGLKFTFGIIAVIWLIDEIFFKRKTFNNLLKSLLFVAGGIIFSLAIIFLPSIHSAETFAAFKEVTAYTARYAALPAVNKELLRSAFYKTGNAVIEIYSLSFVVLALLPIRKFLKIDLVKNEDKNNLLHVIFLATTSFIFLIISAVIERKFFDYHYSRAYIPLCSLAAIGLVSLKDHIVRLYHQYQVSHKLLLAIFSIIGLIFSPLLPWGSLVMGVSTAFFKSSSQYDELIERPISPVFKSQRRQQKEIVEFFKTRQPGNIFVIGMDAARIGYFLKSDPVSKFPTAQFYLGSTAGASWRNEAINEIHKATWIIGQENDSSPYAYDGRSAWQSAINDTLFAPYIYANFAEVENTGYYRILKRK